MPRRFVPWIVTRVPSWPLAGWPGLTHVSSGTTLPEKESKRAAIAAAMDVDVSIVVVPVVVVVAVPAVVWV